MLHCIYLGSAHRNDPGSIGSNSRIRCQVEIPASYPAFSFTQATSQSPCLHKTLTTAAITSKIREACFITLVETDSWQWYLPVGAEFGGSVWERFVRF